MGRWHRLAVLDVHGLEAHRVAVTYSLADLYELRRSLKLRIEAEIRTGDLELAAEAIKEMDELNKQIEAAQWNRKVDSL